ncbi:hypothetical protein [Streptomyces albidoflavus]|uniref:hypothetical protein n=1 Tax=Streptomyces albidoflavus TaxID=1886 RepID=UPI0040569BDF
MTLPGETPDALAEALLHTLASQSSMGLFIFDDGLDLVRHHAGQLLAALGEETGPADRALFRELLDDEAYDLMRQAPRSGAPPRLRDLAARGVRGTRAGLRRASPA